MRSWSCLKQRSKTLAFVLCVRVLTGWSDCLHYKTRSEFSPHITTNQWHRLLKENGSGVDVEVLGQKKEKYRYSSIVISTASGENGPETDPPRMWRFSSTLIFNIKGMLQLQSSRLSRGLSSASRMLTHSLSTSQPHWYSSLVCMISPDRHIIEGLGRALASGLYKEVCDFAGGLI